MSRLIALVDEANSKWTFYQKFIDEQANDQIKVIRSGDTDYSVKLMAVEWVLRYTQFVTPEYVSEAANALRDLYQGKSQQVCEKYISH